MSEHELDRKIIRNALVKSIIAIEDDTEATIPEIFTEFFLLASETINNGKPKVKNNTPSKTNQRDLLKEATYDLQQLSDSIGWVQEDLDKEEALPDLSDIECLEQEMENFLETYDADVLEKLPNDLNKLQKKLILFSKLVREQDDKHGAAAARSDFAESVVDREILTIATVWSIISDIELCEQLLIEHNCLTQEDKDNIFFHKRRCAVHRAEKKTKEAKTAEENGKHAKAQKLRDEAYSFLKKDWSEIMDNEEYPDL